MSTNLTTNPRLHERAAVVLAADVVSERVAPGESFASAEEIVERFGVSRTVARETIQTLSMLGLIRVQHGKRNEVLPPEEDGAKRGTAAGSRRIGLETTRRRRHAG